METVQSSSPTPQPGPVNLNDLQNYLVTFNKEIEPSDVQNFQEGASATVLHVEEAVTGHTACKTADSTVFLETQDEQTSDTAPNITPEDNENDIEVPISLVESPQLTSDVQAQIAHLQTVTVDGLQSVSAPDELMQVQVPVRSITAGTSQQKVVRVVSLDGHESMHIVDSGGDLTSPGTSSPNETLSQPDHVVISSNEDKGTIDGTDPVAVLASVAANTSNVNQIQTVQLEETELNNAQLVALQNSADSTQPQLVAVQTTVGQEGEGLHIVGATDQTGAGPSSVVLNAGGTNYQTVTIMPSEVNQNGEFSYVLIVSNPDGEKDGGNPKSMALDMSMFDVKQESKDIIEEIMEEDGTMKRLVRVAPRLEISDLQGQLQCRYCTYTTSKRYLLMRHMKSHSEEKPHKCNICERGFKTMASLQNHVNTHTGIRPHKCKQCDSAFTTSGELVRHIRYKHTFEKPHKCTECDYASVELSKLKRHMRSHTGERPYHCPHCNYASPDTYKLKRHLRIHTGEKPYVCDVCQARFTQSNSLKAHKLIHSGNKPVFQCDLCPTTCGRRTDLKIHMLKLHTSEKPLVCKKCTKEFPDRYSYKMHLKTHDGEKCFKCDHCEYAALSLRHLESHMLTHTGEKPFNCDECEATFRQKQLLKRHKNLYHTPDFDPTEVKDKTNKTADGYSEPLTADQLIHGSLLTDLKDGKLGDTPKVVIVHPDGRVEEVTSKLQTLAQTIDKEGEPGVMVKMVGDENSSDLVTQHQRDEGTQVTLESDSEQSNESQPPITILTSRSAPKASTSLMVDENRTNVQDDNLHIDLSSAIDQSGVVPVQFHINPTSMAQTVMMPEIQQFVSKKRKESGDDAEASSSNKKQCTEVLS